MPILDTDLIVGVFRNDHDAVEKVRALELEGSERYTTTITAFELFEGAYRSHDSKKAKELEFVREFLNSVDEVFALDYGASEIAGRIMADLQKKGTPLDLADVMIAAIAIKNKDYLISRNKKHFSRIEGLMLQEW